MPRDIELVKQELESSTTSIFITKWILEHTPYVFEDYETEYISWRHEIAEKLRIDARDIIITGSASLGFSLNPNKNFKSLYHFSRYRGNRIFFTTGEKTV